MIRIESAPTRYLDDNVSSLGHDFIQDRTVRGAIYAIDSFAVIRLTDADELE
jgi:hypothetical protein